MNITSDTVYMNKSYSQLLSTISYLVYIITSITILMMSFGYLTPDYIVALIALIVSLVISNTNYATMSKEYLQTLEDNAISVVLKEKPILGTTSLILSVAMLVTLITFNMFAWKTYIVYLIIATIISKAHKSRLGIVEKD